MSLAENTIVRYLGGVEECATTGKIHLLRVAVTSTSTGSITLNGLPESEVEHHIGCESQSGHGAVSKDTT